MTYTYTYDDNGNILTISDGTYTTSYVYDSQNQLIRENNEYDYSTWTWDYDSAGNIRWERLYDYSTEEEPEDLFSTNTYSYDDTWGDILVGVGSITYTVDAIGNRTSRRYGSSSYVTTYTWEHGRQLASVTNGTNTWQYKYNNDGMLIEQRNGNDVYTYVYNGTQLSQMSYVGSWEEYTMHFTYDANGTPLTVTFDYAYYMDERTYDEATGTFLDDAEIDYSISDTYYYITNIQGDVIELLNSDGESAGYYRYNAWGYDIDMYDNEDIIYYNPLRYRSYFYDRVSGFYYLQTRFYDASVGRFINADNTNILLATPMGLTDKNLFAYCDNNPVMRADHGGDFWHIVAGAVVGALIGGAVKVVSNAVQGKSLTNGLGTAMLAGAASGALAATGAPIAGVIAGNAAISMIENAANQVIENKGFDNFDVDDMLIDGVVGGVSGALGGAGEGTKHLTNLGKQTVKRTVNTTTNSGLKAGINEARKAFAYYAKNTSKYYKNFTKGIPKDFVHSFGTSIASTDYAKYQYRRVFGR